jgi:DnaK suppressor protein
MTREHDLKKLKNLLEQRRESLQRTSAAAREELHALKNQERDPEYEESAQSELADYTLSHVVEAQRKEMMSIDAALTRMEENVYGVCVDCGNAISLERLKALPFALRCEEDAQMHERERMGSGASALPSL